MLHFFVETILLVFCSICIYIVPSNQLYSLIYFLIIYLQKTLIDDLLSPNTRIVCNIILIALFLKYPNTLPWIIITVPIYFIFTYKPKQTKTDSISEGILSIKLKLMINTLICATFLIYLSRMLPVMYLVGILNLYYVGTIACSVSTPFYRVIYKI